MRRSGIDDILPLSPLQEGLFFHANFDDAAPDVYIDQHVIDLDGQLDTAALRTAAQSLLRRHPNLRAAFVQGRSGKPVQLVPATLRVPWKEVDLSELSEAEREDQPAWLQAEERRRRFTLSKPPLLRFLIARTGHHRHRMVFTNHHILLDGWSTEILIRELLTLYSSRGGLPKVTPYRDYLLWVQAQDRTVAERAWSDALHGVEEPTLLAPQTVDQTPATPKRVVRELPEDLSRALTEQARHYGITPNTILQGSSTFAVMPLRPPRPGGGR